MKHINNVDVNIEHVGQTIELFGWINKKRKIGKLVFIDLRDISGLIQLVIKSDLIKQPLLKESVLKVNGVVQKRPNANKDLKTGKIEIKIKSFQLLSSAKQLPFEINSEIIPNEDLRFKYRFLDLRRKIMKQNIILRSKISHIIRNFFIDKKFFEIETPILGRLTPEGARDYIVPTRTQDQFFALPQSPQIYKQILMASGFEKYFQLAKTFRDEDGRRDRQPEFTQLDIEMSFVEEKDIINLTTEFFQDLFHKLNIPIANHIPLMEYDFAMENYGSDKPDLRFGNLLIDIKKDLKNSKFNIFQKSESTKMIVFDQNISKKEFSHLEKITKKNKGQTLFYATKNQVNYEGSLFKLAKNDLDLLIENHNEVKNKNQFSIFIVSGNKEDVNNTLGVVRTSFAKLKNIQFKTEYALIWIVNQPLFEYSKTENRYLSAHHPFTMPTLKNENNFEMNLKNARARAYDIVLNGYEIGGGSIRINNFEIQKRMFYALGFSDQQMKANFGFFLKIFDYGLPPHGGIALGIDRLVSVIAKTDSIRDVIAFPKNSKGYDLMSQSPNKISDKILNELFLKVKE